LRISKVTPPIRLESEYNDTLGSADEMMLSPGTPGHQLGQTAGSVLLNDSGDYYCLGQIDEGSSISLQLQKPSDSSLSGELGLYNSLGQEMATGALSLTYSVNSGAAGVYFVQVTAVAGSEGLFSQYLLDVDIADPVTPTVVSTSFGSEGEVHTSVIDHFTVTFSEDMNAATINDVDHLDLREAGPDGAFDTADDIVYTLSDTGYTVGLSLEYRISDGPLQAGSYRLTLETGLTDRAGNALSSAFVRTFSVAALPGSMIEDRSNDTSSNATGLTLIEDPTGLFWACGQGNLSGCADMDYWSFDAGEGDKLTLAVDIPDYSGRAYQQFVIFQPDGNTLGGVYFYFDGEVYGQTDPLTLTQNGIYTVRVAQYTGSPHEGEYRLRISKVTSPIQMESKHNDALSIADEMILSPGDIGHQIGQTVGCVFLNDSGDYYGLGQIDEGSSISLELQTPSSSSLSGNLSLYNSQGLEVATSSPSLNYDVNTGASGIYFAQVTALADSEGLFSQYVLNVDITDPVPPTVVSTSLG
jgi:hypothetical protein